MIHAMHFQRCQPTIQLNILKIVREPALHEARQVQLERS